MEFSKVTECDTNINGHHKTRKKHADNAEAQARIEPPLIPLIKAMRTKDGETRHHQDQDAPRSGVSYIRDLQVEGPDIRKWQTRRVPPDDEGLKDRH